MAPIANAGLPHFSSARTTPTNSEVRRPQPTFALRRTTPVSARPKAIAAPVARSTEATPLTRQNPLSTSPTRVWT
jgi:hypothetical protein